MAQSRAANLNLWRPDKKTEMSKANPVHRNSDRETALADSIPKLEAAQVKVHRDIRATNNEIARCMVRKSEHNDLIDKVRHGEAGLGPVTGLDRLFGLGHQMIEISLLSTTA
jgi:hypothetical protein